MPRAESAAPVCDLGALGGARGRHRCLLTILVEAALVVEETPRGWRLELPAQPRLFRTAASWIALERLCCPFVGFHLQWTVRGRVLVEAVTGAAGREALRAGLDAALADRGKPRP